MVSYIIRRIFQSIIVTFLVTIIVFIGMRLLPGDPIYMIINTNTAQDMTAEELDRLRHEAGLDRNLVIQYFDWLGGVFQGNLGNSIFL